MNWYALLFRNAILLGALLAAGLLSDEGKERKTRKGKRKKGKGTKRKGRGRKAGQKALA